MKSSIYSTQTVTGRVTRTVPSGGSGGTSDHASLTNRDAPNQHPISAITGLSDRVLPVVDTADNGKVPKVVGGRWVKEQGVTIDNLHVLDASDVTSGTYDFSDFNPGDIIFVTGDLGGVVN